MDFLGTFATDTASTGSYLVTTADELITIIVSGDGSMTGSWMSIGALQTTFLPAPVYEAQFTLGEPGQVLTHPLDRTQTIRTFSPTLKIEKLDIGQF
jgi:hypothetical protein